MTYSENRSYPTIGESFGILGIIILTSVLALAITPLTLFFSFIDDEALQLIYYLFGVGTSFLIVYSIRKRKTGKSTFNLTIQDPRVIPFIALASVALLLGVILPIIDLIPMPEFFKNEFLKAAAQSGFSTFLLLVIAAPFFEELIFRGIILDGLLKKYSPATSILISSILFGLAHLSPWQGASGFIIGIFAGWIYYKSQSLSLTMIIHAAVNLTAYSMRYSAVHFGDSFERMLTSDFTTVASILVLFACVYHLNNVFMEKENASR
jgi:uncharacterized protein